MLLTGEAVRKLWPRRRNRRSSSCTAQIQLVAVVLGHPDMATGQHDRVLEPGMFYSGQRSNKETASTVAPVVTRERCRFGVSSRGKISGQRRLHWRSGYSGQDEALCSGQRGTDTLRLYEAGIVVPYLSFSLPLVRS
jgi:hypothetical protein